MLNAFIRFTTALALFTAAGFLFVAIGRNQHGGGLLALVTGEGGEKFTPAAGPAIKAEDVPSLQQMSSETTKLVDAVVPAVVRVNTTTRYRVGQPTLTFRGIGMRYTEEELGGLGSGVIVSEEGHVVTNYHVIESQVRGKDTVDEVTVTTHDRRQHLATIIGFDADADIAVLKIQNPKARKFTCLRWADSDKVRVGAWVWAVGNPFGLSESVTMGIISHRDRQVTDGDMPKLQTDTVINRGNSGGPLVNTNGEIIGINVAIFQGQQDVTTWQGVSLAIPANDAYRSFKRIMEKGKETIGYLGLQAESRGKDDDGQEEVVIKQVFSGSPAEKAGLKQGDVVLKFSDREVASPVELYKFINRRPVGQSVELVIRRDGKEQTIQATVANREDAVSADEKASERRDFRDLLGIEVRALTELERKRGGVKPDSPGIVISSVDQDSSADGTLFKGDIILQVNRTPINSTEEFYSVVKAMPEHKPYVLYIWRNGRTIPLTVTP